MDDIDKFIKAISTYGIAADEAVRAFGIEAVPTVTTPDGERLEIIDGCDVVPLSESEYYGYGSGAWSIDLDKPNDLIEI